MELSNSIEYLNRSANSDSEWNQKLQVEQDTIELSEGWEQSANDLYLDEDLSAKTYDFSIRKVDKFSSAKTYDFSIRKIGKEEISDDETESIDMNDIFDNLTNREVVRHETLLILIQNVINDCRSDKSTEELNRSVTKMFENIECFLSQDERDEQIRVINQLETIFSQHGWQFPDFVVRPNVSSLIGDLLTLIDSKSIRSPYYYNNIA